MKELVLGEDQRVADWVADKIGRDKWMANFAAVGIERDGRLVGGCVIDGYIKDLRCNMHVAGEGKNWLTHEFLKFCFSYVFYGLNCKVVIGPVPATNTAALKLDKHLGFEEAGRIKDGSLDGDLVLLQMPKDQCRWLEKKP